MKNLSVDLRSDTLTKPSPEMIEFMMEAAVGDDCYEEDPSVNNLEAYCAELFGKQAALFVPSGTMANQIAVKVQTRPGDEVITESRYHISYFESGATAAQSGVCLNAIHTSDGIIRKSDLQQALESKPRNALYAQGTLLTLENTVSALGGKLYPVDDLAMLYTYAREKGVNVHLDGARLFNAHVASGISLKKYAALADSVSVCLSKGLGAPVGSVLLGTESFIEKAKRVRKWLGGGLHQAGFMAAAGLYGLKSNLSRLEDDHRRARNLAEQLISEPNLKVNLVDVETNFVLFDVTQTGLNPEQFTQRCAAHEVKLFPWTNGQVRAAIHMQVTDEGVARASEIIRRVAQSSYPHETSAQSLYHPGHPSRYEQFN